MSNITKKDVEHVAGLARIKLTDSEKEKLAKDLGAILGYIDKLKEVNTEGVEVSGNIMGMENVFRKDSESERFPEEKINKMIEHAPSHQAGYVKVRSVFENDSDA